MTDNILPTVSLDFHRNEEIVVSRRKRENRPNFIMVGSGQVGRHNIESIDLLHEIAVMNADEKFCFFIIKDHIVYNAYDECFIYQVNISNIGLTKSQKNRFRKGYRSLRDKELARRVNSSTYMISPYAIVPQHFNKEAKIWNSIGDNNE